MVLVSVCIPTYNRAHYLTYAVQSVLNQDFTDFELIICDDGSTDSTSELIQKWTDPRLRYLRHPKNIGRSRNMRSGFEIAKGDYFIKFDDDDALTSDFLRKTVSILEKFPQVDFVCTNHWVINADNQRMLEATQENCIKWGKDQLKEGIIADLLEETFLKQSLQIGSTLFRRSCLQAVNFMRADLTMCEDYDVLIRLALQGAVGYFLPEYLMEYRFHTGQSSLAQSLTFLEAKLICLESYTFPLPYLEQHRLKKIAETQEDLALRLLESGETQEGRALLKISLASLGWSKRSLLGLMLSYLSPQLRQQLFHCFRQLRPQDYSEKVRMMERAED
ncbi:MAG: glycosyltransferase family 2 protein [Woronichinia naegeliana WA131]|uniref:Glycosyltransferase family 2 protein n=1 Tax=Woronichinia naegeliana WA131 TaxID=2824559 RepID=A0A977PXM7_9CYAN|nr:MAG: glycosyltransferase family 2 protein [Woronichinia naegeliana WA131]